MFCDTQFFTLEFLITLKEEIYLHVNNYFNDISGFMFFRWYGNGNYKFNIILSFRKNVVTFFTTSHFLPSLTKFLETTPNLYFFHKTCEFLHIVLHFYTQNCIILNL